MPRMPSEGMLDASVQWRVLSENDEGWRQVRCLYAYLAPDMREVLYVGKAWGATVRDRWRRNAKEDFWDDLERIRRIRKHCVILGEIGLADGRRLTHELLSDLESLLIWRLEPWGNIQCIRSRIGRPQLALGCYGDWPVDVKLFRDAA